MPRMYSTPRVMVDITKAIIDESIRNNSSHCMVAEAIRLAVPGARRVAVDIFTCRFTDPHWPRLHCRDCDCDHFWYSVPQTRNSDLVVLQPMEVCAEATVIDKLRAVSRENGATPDEVITAQSKIIALMSKDTRLAA